MKTKRLDKKDVVEAAEIIKSGGIVAFPTETVYGLGADVFNEGAVKKIFEVKGRPADNPLIVHIADKEDVEKIAFVNENAKKLIDKFWPGPLTIILKKKDIPDIVTAGLDSVAIRMPRNETALELIRKSGMIAAPSANLSGKPSATNFKHVLDDFDGKVDAIIKDEDSEIGLESSVIDLTGKPKLLRPGGLSLEDVEKVIGKLEVSDGNEEIIKSPGMKHKHYSPNAILVLVEGDNHEIVREEIDRMADEYSVEGKKVEIMYNEELQKFAKSLFKRMRELDKEKVDVIIVEGVKEAGIGLAVMNRLRKAASRTIKV